MKKSLILVGMLVVGYANAQEEYNGKVGINTEEPKATFEILPSKSNLEGTTNEGLLIPRLTKARVLAIASDKLVEGTKVYITDEVLASDNAKFQGTGKGFYYYNGAKWVKQLDSDNDTNIGYWAEGNNADGTKYYYFIPFSESGNEYSFNKRGMGREAFEYKYTNTDNFTKTNSTSEWWGFNDASYFVGKDHINNANNTKNEVRYQAQFRGLYTDNDATRKIRSLLGGTNVATLGDNSGGSTIGTPLTSVDAGSVTGFATRGDVYTSGTVDELYGFATQANNIGGGTVTRQYGADIMSRNRTNGTSTNIYGTRSRVILEQNSTSDLAFGGLFQVGSTNASISTAIQAFRTDVTLNNSQVKHETASSIGLRNILDISNNSSIKNYTASQMSINKVDGTSSVENYIGYGMTIFAAVEKDKITNLYGIKLPDIDKGKEANYAIHTGKGKVLFGDLAGVGNRPVYAAEDGTLMIGEANTGATTLTGEENLACNDANRGKMNFVKDVAIGSGTGDAFAVCLKGTDGKFYWRYLYGASGVTNSTENFGIGLQ